MKATVETVTPELAARWLEGAGQNRSLSETTWQDYAYKMRTERWRLNPNAGIMFDEDGRLVDGQHRLKAVVVSGVTVEMWIYRGVSKEIAETVDVGRPRTIADAERIATGDVRATQKRAVIALMFQIERGHPPRLSLEAYRDVGAIVGWDHLDVVCAASRAMLSSPMAAALVYARPIDPAKVDDLMRKIVTRDLSLGTLAAIDHVLADRHKIAGERRGSCFKLMRGVQAILRDERIERLHDGNRGYLWLKREREKRGLPGTVIPMEYRGK